MASRKSQLLLSLALLAASVAVTTLLYLTRPTAEIADPVYKPVSVDVAEAVKQDLRIQVQAQGTVTPLRQTLIQSEVSGRIIEVSEAFLVGGFVSTGDVLLRIDPSDYETSLLRAQAGLRSAESNLAQEEGRAEVALREWQKLPEGSQRSDQARDLYLRKPQLELAQAQLLSAQADLDTAQDNLDRTTIRAPYDAIISAKHSELGKFVTIGSPLVDLSSVDYAEVRLAIPQGKLAYLELPDLGGSGAGSTIDLYTDVGGEVKHWVARLHRTEGVFDERSRALFAVARIEDPYGRRSGAEPLRIGTFVNANIAGRVIQDIVTLPRYVLRAGNNVWVVDDSMHLRNRPLTLLQTGGDFIYVSGGLDNGDLVSLTTLDSSFESAEVRIQSRTRTDKLGEAVAPQQPAKELDTAAVDVASDKSPEG